MKIPKIRRLDCGTYFCQLRLKQNDGTTKSIAVSGDTEDEVFARVAAIKAGIIEVKRRPLTATVGQAIDEYIQAREGIASASTIYGYKKMRQNYFTELMEVRLCDLTEKQAQRAVSALAKTHSAKTVANAYGLLSSALKKHKISFDIMLPQKERYDYAIPNEEDIQKIISGVKGSEIELPVLLALWLGLRMSEIRGLKKSDLRDGVLHINKAVVYVGAEDVEKPPKNYTSDRYLPCPEYIQNLIKALPQEQITTLKHGTIYKRFVKLCDELKLSQHYRFHDLRHANASFMLALGIPNKYAQQRMGHSTDNMLKSVYQHTIPKDAEQFNNLINEKFSEMFNLK